MDTLKLTSYQANANFDAKQDHINEQILFLAKSRPQTKT